MPEQIPLFQEMWMRRSELRDFISYVEAAESCAHMHEPGYDFASSWPRWCWNEENGPRIAWLQRARVYERPRQCNCGVRERPCLEECEDDAWPVMCRPIGPHEASCASLKRPLLVYSRERRPERCTHWRYIFTDADGYVVDESEWCATEGGARGYLNRARQTKRPACSSFDKAGFGHAERLAAVEGCGCVDCLILRGSLVPLPRLGD